MRLLLTIAVSIFVLAGCADAFDQSASACKAPPDQHALWQIPAGGVWSVGENIPGQYKAKSTVCVHKEDDKAPENHDLQKIGGVFSPTISSGAARSWEKA